jgi:hypothetical protein
VKQHKLNGRTDHENNSTESNEDTLELSFDSVDSDASFFPLKRAQGKVALAGLKSRVSQKMLSHEALQQRYKQQVLPFQDGATRSGNASSLPQRDSSFPGTIERIGAVCRR